MKNLDITYSGPSRDYKGVISAAHFETKFGQCLAAATDEGLCNLIFFNELEDALSDLRGRWKKAKIIANHSPDLDSIRDYLTSLKPTSKMKLHLHGTIFQIKVWKALLSIPEGHITSYGEIARKIGSPRAFQATGGAVSDNPIAYIIPCHRVLKSTGEISGYRWGIERKRAMLAYESQRSTEYQE